MTRIRVPIPMYMGVVSPWSAAGRGDPRLAPTHGWYPQAHSAKPRANGPAAALTSMRGGGRSPRRLEKQ
jgi:hypothetical protein